LPATWETLLKSYEKKAKVWDKQVLAFGAIKDHLSQLRQIEFRAFLALFKDIVSPGMLEMFF
jgi:hypothetical protein